MNEEKELTSKFYKRLHNTGKPLEDYISVEEIKGENTSQVGLRLPNSLNDRFEKCISFDNTTKSKLLRTLIEFYIVSTEESMKEETNKLKLLLSLNDLEQLEELSKLSPEEQKEFNLLKIQYLKDKMANQSLEEQIKKGLN